MLPRRDWVTINRIRSNVGKCKSNLIKLRIMNYAKCDCNAQIQTVHHIFNRYPLTKYENGLEDLHKVTLNAKYWMNNLKM